MQKRTFVLIFLILFSGIFVLPKEAFTRDDRSRLQGRWYLDGDPNKVAEINADRRGPEARNENGDTTRLDLDQMVMFALSIGTISAVESVGTASNGTMGPRGHGGRPIDTAGAKFLFSGNNRAEYPTKSGIRTPAENQCSSRAPLPDECQERKVRITTE